MIENSLSVSGYVLHELALTMLDAFLPPAVDLRQCLYLPGDDTEVRVAGGAFHFQAGHNRPRCKSYSRQHEF